MPSASSPVPRAIRRGALYPLLASGHAALAHLPAKAAFGVADAAARGAFRLLARDRARMAEHIAIAFPDLSEADRTRVAREAFRHFGRVFVEAARLPAMTRADMDRQVRLHDPHDVMGQVRAMGRGAIGVTGHLGNWELLVAYLSRHGMPCAAVATRFRDPRVNEMIVALRAASGVDTIQRDEGPRPILRALREGRTLGLLIDQDTTADGEFVPFFGRPAYTPRGPGVLHVATQAPVFTAFCIRAADGTYDLFLEGFLEEAPKGLKGEAREAATRAIVAEATRRIEAAVRRAPTQWVWWHRRWKTQPAARAAAAPVAG
jgi:KDO2-lipid IV(A) lauroyltransferase